MTRPRPARPHQMSSELRLSPLNPALPDDSQKKLRWSHLYGSARGLAIHTASQHQNAPIVAIVPDTPSAMRLTEELRFYAGPGRTHGIHQFPDWETLPYDVFSPYHDIVSERGSHSLSTPRDPRGGHRCSGDDPYGETGPAIFFIG